MNKTSEANILESIEQGFPGLAAKVVDGEQYAEDLAPIVQSVLDDPSISVVRFPKGRYRFLSSLIIRKPLQLYGEGFVNSKPTASLFYGSELHSSADVGIILSSSYVSISDLSLQGRGSALSQTGIELGNSSRSVQRISMTGVYIDGFQRSLLHIVNCTESVFDRIVGGNANIGLLVDGDARSLEWWTCTFTHCTREIQINAGIALSFHNFTCESNLDGQDTLVQVESLSGTEVRDVCFESCYLGPRNDNALVVKAAASENQLQHVCLRNCFTEQDKPSLVRFENMVNAVVWYCLFKNQNNCQMVNNGHHKYPPNTNL